jgi:hypothetical protein
MAQSHVPHIGCVRAVPSTGTQSTNAEPGKRTVPHANVSWIGGVYCRLAGAMIAAGHNFAQLGNVQRSLP